MFQDKSELKKQIIKNLFFHFYFLAKDFSLNTVAMHLKFYTHVDNILMEGTVSQIFYLGLSFDFMTKNGKLFVIF